MSTVIGFAGMTHLGLLSAAAAADRGFQVVAYDPAPAVTAALQSRPVAIVEPDLPELMARHRERIMFTEHPAELGRCDVVYVAADVPTDEHGRSDLDPIRAMVVRVAGAQSPQSTLVVLSQVPPGFTRALPVPTDRLYYQVETLVFGRAVERATAPERFIVGCADPSRPLPGRWAEFLSAFSCPILPMRYESAELAKISINVCLVASLSVANQLAELSGSQGPIGPRLFRPCGSTRGSALTPISIPVWGSAAAISSATCEPSPPWRRPSTWAPA